VAVPAVDARGLRLQHGSLTYGAHATVVLGGSRRFELVVANAREDRPELIDRTIISEDEVEKRIGEAERLLQLGLVAAAFVVVWVAVEAAARGCFSLKVKMWKKVLTCGSQDTLRVRLC